MARRDEEPGHHLVDDRRLVRGERQVAGPCRGDRDVSQRREVLGEATGDLAEPCEGRVRVELARVIRGAAEQYLARGPLDEQRQKRGLLAGLALIAEGAGIPGRDRKSTRLNSSHPSISYAVFCLKKKNRCGG